MRRPLIAVLALFTLGLPGGVTAQEGPQVLTSDNVEFVGTIPVAAAASSIQFASDAPIAYISTFRGLEVWDITNPALPLPLGRAALGGWQNEAMSLGERPNGDRFVLFAQNTAVLTQADAVYGRRVTVVEVTDPRNPVVHGTVTTPTRTHTASCVNKECTFAYTDGRTQGRISVIDLRDFRNPKMASIPELTTPVAQGHDQDVDEAGILWHVGGQGSVAMDVTDPERPRLLNSTTQAGATPP
ncbi:MAG TPA: hypothetical protein VM638_01870, partial [Actinomycetota bacterium]|nr:hypothetical protein [Actinomycetota bacterium]